MSTQIRYRIAVLDGCMAAGSWGPDGHRIYSHVGHAVFTDLPTTLMAAAISTWGETGTHWAPPRERASYPAWGHGWEVAWQPGSCSLSLAVGPGGARVLGATIRIDWTDGRRGGYIAVESGHLFMARQDAPCLYVCNDRGDRLTPSAVAA